MTTIHTVKILKIKNGLPTLVQIAGEKYALVPQDYINGNKNKVGKKVSK
ncbi:MAG: hypothetical protein ABS939_02530 [Psychrobacillus sp.]